MNSKINPTHLEYQDPLTPYSRTFDDIYFSAKLGIEESTYVYIEGTHVREAILSGRPSVCVGEIGFGVGLNFILTLKNFIELAKPDQHLTYISVEKCPVFKEDLSELYSRFSELKPVSDLLLDHYPLLTPGMHAIRFKNIPVTLVLMLGDATEMYSNLEAKIDHWYFDGFTPSKNPDAFSEALFLEIARLSSPTAMGASFTAAGWVRRSLESVGFKVEKRLGYGKKRECIQATRVETLAVSTSKIPAWFSNQNLTFSKPGQDRIGIIGAGLAGSALAQSFSNRGFEVHIIDQGEIAEQASGNDAGLFDAQLSKDTNPMSRFSQLSLSHFLRELNFHKKNLDFKSRSGILRFDPATVDCMENSEYPANFYQFLTAPEASKIAGIQINRDSVYFPSAGMLNPRSLCKARLKNTESNHQNKIILHAKVYQIIKNKNSFLLYDQNQKLITEVEHLVYASGAATLTSFLELSDFQLKAVRGQIIHVKPTTQSQSLQVTLVDQGYVTPIDDQITQNHCHLMGATYQTKNFDPQQVELDTATLIESAKQKWNCFQSLSTSDVTQYKVGYRLSTPDKLPLMGPISNLETMRTRYSRMLRGAKIETLAPLEVSPREWLFLGFGSRGITFTSYAAEILATLMCGPLASHLIPIELDLWQHLHSSRFFVRKLKKPV